MILFRELPEGARQQRKPGCLSPRSSAPNPKREVDRTGCARYRADECRAKRGTRVVPQRKLCLCLLLWETKAFLDVRMNQGMWEYELTVDS